MAAATTERDPNPSDLGDAAPASDHELVERWRRGDRRAPNLLIARYWASIRTYFRRRVAASDSEDLLQETLAKATRSVANFEFRSSFRAYLFGIAAHTLKDHLRARGRRPLIEALDERAVSPMPPAEQLLIEVEQLQLALACVNTLSPEKRRLVHRFYVQRLSARDIATEDRTPPGTIRRRLFDAREAMQHQHVILAKAGRTADIQQLEAFFDWLPSDCTDELS